jgi:chromosome segregation ATPase
MPSCPECKTKELEPVKTWNVMSDPDKMGSFLDTKIGIYQCSKCGTRFPSSLGRQKLRIVTQKQLDNLDATLKELKEKNEELLAKYAESRKREDERQAEVVMLKERVARLEEEVSERQKEAERHSKNVTELTNKLNLAQIEVKDFQQKCFDFENRNAQLTHENERLEEDRKKIREFLSQVELENQILHNKVVDIQSANSGLTDTINAVESELAQKIQEIEEMKFRYESEIDRLKGENEELKYEISKLHQNLEIRKLVDTAETLQEEISILRQNKKEIESRIGVIMSEQTVAQPINK